MNHRHAAAVALLGWYLMVPPLEGKGKYAHPNIEAPLRARFLDSSYDSAKECAGR
jgi:hypothetical protein